MTDTPDAVLTGKDSSVRGITWEQAFPEWHLVEENVRVGGDQPIALTPHEERVDTIMEVAATFRGSVDHATGRLYPLVPSLFPLLVAGQSTTTTFSSIAAAPAADVFASSTRAEIRRLHQTFAQVNAASAIVGARQWPRDPVFAAFTAGFFHLSPLNFYLITHVGLGRNSPDRARQFVAEAADVADMTDHLESITASASAAILSGELERWLEPLRVKTTPIHIVDVAKTHPQMLTRLPMQDFTLAEALGFLVPEWTLHEGRFIQADSNSPLVDVGDHALSLIVSHPGITSNELSEALGVEPGSINRILATRGLAHSRQQKDTKNRTWTTPAWHRLGIRDTAELNSFLLRERLTVADLGLTTAGAPEPFSAPEAPTTRRSSAQVEVTPSEIKSSPTDPGLDPNDGTDRLYDLPGPNEQLEAWEKILVSRFDGATLAIQVNLAADDLRLLLDAFSRRFAVSQGRRTSATQFIRLFPASTLAALVGVASTEFENNTYWSHFFQAINVPQNDAIENALRQAVRGLIDQFNLDPLSSLSVSRHVERLTVHAGIPASNFGALLEALMSYVALVDNREDQPFQEWIEEPSHEVLLHSLNAPARSFIRHGGPKAAEYLAILVEVVSIVAEDPTTDGAEIAASLSDNDLPPLVREALAAAFQQMDVGENVRVKRSRSRAVPVLRLGSDDSVVIRLPAPPSYVDRQWAITLDSDVRLVSPERLDRDQGVDVILDAPVRRAVVSHPSFEHPIEMRLFDSGSPLIAFTVDGDHISSGRRLPRGEVVVLHPKTWSLAETADSAPMVRGSFDSPQGWAGWALQTWDLSEVEAFRLSSDTGSAVDITVGTRQLPSLDFDDGEALPLEGVSHGALPVFGYARPWVSLPALRDTDETGWTVQYRRSGSADWVVQDEYSPNERESYELFANEPPLLGAYEVLVTGPDATRFSTEIFLADGLNISFDDDCRIPEGDQMTPVTAYIECSMPTLRASDDQLYFDPAASHRDLRLRLGDIRHDVRIRPPRLEFRMTPVRAVPVWSDRRISRHPDEFHHATLAIRGVPDGVDVNVEIVDDSGTVKHTHEFRDQRHRDAFIVKTDEFAHAAHRCQFGELRVSLHYPDGASYSAPLVRFSALGHNYKITIDENTILVANLSTNEHLECHVWQMDRPWLEPLSVSVVDGRAELPASAHDSGSLRVSVHVSDAWDPVPPARFPDRRSIHLYRRGKFSPTNKGLVSQFLSGQNHLPEFSADTPEAWAALAFLDLELDENDRGRYEAIAEVMAGSPRTAARALAEANLPNDEKLAQFIGSGLVFDSLTTPHGQPPRTEIVPEAWLDMLFAIVDIPSQPYDRRIASLERVGEVGGSSLRVILAKGTDPEAKQTYIDSAAVFLSSRPEALRTVLQGHKLVPGSLVDAAARYDGFLELFERRTDMSKELLADLNKAAAHDNRAPFNALRKYPSFREIFTIRADQLDGVDPVEHGWACATFISLGLSLYARLVSRNLLLPEGQADAAHLRKTWSQFARLQPLETMIDIVIADGLSAHFYFARQGQFPFTGPDTELVDQLLAPLDNDAVEKSLVP